MLLWVYLFRRRRQQMAAGRNFKLGYMPNHYTSNKFPSFAFIDAISFLLPGLLCLLYTLKGFCISFWFPISSQTMKVSSLRCLACFPLEYRSLRVNYSSLFMRTVHAEINKIQVKRPAAGRFRYQRLYVYTVYKII